MNTKKIEKFILDYIGAKKISEEIESKDDQLTVIQSLEREGLIHFSFEERSSDCDYWIKAETGINIKLDCERYIGIVFDHNVKLYSEPIKEFIMKIKEYEKTALKIHNLLKKI